MVDQINQNIVEQQIMTVDDVSDEEKNHIKQETIFAGPNILKLQDTKYCKFVGFVDPIKRKELLSNSKLRLALASDIACASAPAAFFLLSMVLISSSDIPRISFLA